MDRGERKSAGETSHMCQGQLICKFSALIGLGHIACGHQRTLCFHSSLVQQLSDCTSCKTQSTKCGEKKPSSTTSFKPGEIRLAQGVKRQLEALANWGSAPNATLLWPFRSTMHTCEDVSKCCCKSLNCSLLLALCT